MRFLLLILTATALTTQGATNEMAKVRVTGDRVSLRSGPNMDAEILDRAMRGDEMNFFDRTNGWVAVQAPESLDFWVAAEFIDNGTVTPKKLNVRSGPSKNYSVVTIVLREEKVKIRGEFNEWLKIAPPNGSRVWISEDYVEMLNPPKRKAAAAASPAQVPDVEGQTDSESLMLVLDKTKHQGKVETMPGVLRRANPGLYKLVLVADGIDEPVCLVRGRESQLEKMLNRSLLIEGKVYWVKDVDLPVIQPDKIHLDPILGN